MRDFRIVVAAHGALAAGFVSAAELICGGLDDTAAVGLEPEDTPEAFAERLTAAVADAGTERPLLLLTDLTGGTPHNVARVVARRLPRAALVSGMNLAVLIEAVTSVESLDPEVLERLVAAGRAALVGLELSLTTSGP